MALLGRVVVVSIPSCRSAWQHGPMPGLLEVIAMHEADARRAEEGGADRVELLGSLDDGGMSPEPALVEKVRAAVLRYVRAHATEPDLSLPAVAAAVGWSARHIQAVLSRTGESFSDAVRGERLDLARDRLTDPRWAARGISFIADSVGYGSASAFSTAFSRRFGRSPRAHRAAAG